MSLIEHEAEEHLSREEAAKRLRAIADELSRHNELSFLRDGVRYTVTVPDDLTLTLEIEVGETDGEIEVELKWGAGRG